MPFVDAENFEERMKYTRAVPRINSRVNLAVEWTEDHRALRAEGFTVDISAKGTRTGVTQPARRFLGHRPVASLL